MSDKVLKAIVCGYERGGTTLLSQLMSAHPRLDSGFESGLLLADEPKNFMSKQFAEFNGSLIRRGWGVDEDDLAYILDSKTWNQVYLRLRERSSVIKNKESFLIDKTPKYMLRLSDVLYRMEQVPCVVVVKEPRGVIFSWLKRQPDIDFAAVSRETLKAFCKRYVRYAAGYAEAKRNHPRRILKVDYEKFCLHPKSEAQLIFNHLGLEFHDDYLTFEQKYEVHGTTVSGKYLNQYRDVLHASTIEQIDEWTADSAVLLSL